ncbi:hypothetical protein VRHSUH09_06655 [Veillonella rogosae JCM 15642]|uniref:DUF2634 domain-containing protein n=1 Tax=Veillonella rogosae JCM 15642 TaxID=1298595 RepID=A0ABX5BX54_9FIRM|nr:hypothetical protein [Veillonella rogosae]PQL12093.1 hypothetical protein VRHSUH09_06655 [Veillonella rogosae JCM 15642]
MKPDKMTFTEKTLFAFYANADTVRSLFTTRDYIYCLIDTDKGCSVKAKVKQLLKRIRLDIKLLDVNVKRRKNLVFDEMEVETINILLNIDEINYTVKINVGLTGEITIVLGFKFADKPEEIAV